MILWPIGVERDLPHIILHDQQAAALPAARRASGQDRTLFCMPSSFAMMPCMTTMLQRFFDTPAGRRSDFVESNSGARGADAAAVSDGPHGLLCMIGRWA